MDELAAGDGGAVLNEEGDLEQQKPGGLNQRNVDCVCFFIVSFRVRRG